MRRFAGAIALLVVLGACGAGNESAGGVAAPGMTSTRVSVVTTAPAPAPDPGFPVLVEGVTIERRPGRIVSLSPTATEILFAVGAGDQVVAVDDQSNHPAEAPVTNLSGFSPNVEAIVGFDPDLVVVSYDPGDLVASLSALGVPVLMQPAAVGLDDTYAQIEELGAASGHRADAAALAGRIESDIDQIVAAVPPGTDSLTYFHELGPDLYSLTSQTYAGSLYAMLGMKNIADPADADGFGYPQLSSEYVIDEDPDFIFLADATCCGTSPEMVAERPGWGSLTAVMKGRVVVVDEDIASRWGPRVVEFLESVVGALTATAGVGG